MVAESASQIANAARSDCWLLCKVSRKPTAQRLPGSYRLRTVCGLFFSECTNERIVINAQASLRKCLFSSSFPSFRFFS